MKRKLIGATLLAVAVALIVSNLAGIWLLRQQELSAARETLSELLILMDAQNQITDAQGVSAQFSQAAPEKRLTIMTPQGQVLADTKVSPSTLGSHAGREELVEANVSGWGEAIRPSETTGQSTFYVAKRFADNMVGRASMSLSSIDSLVWRSAGGFLIASVVGLLVAMLLARRMARQVLKPLGVVGDALQGVLNGTPAQGLAQYKADDEVRPLLRYIDKLVERLGSSIEGLTAERDKVNFILDCMDEGLLLLDSAGNILAINRAARALFGVPAGEDAGSIMLLTRSRRLRQALEEMQAQQTGVVLDMDAPTQSGHTLRIFLAPVTGRQYEGEQVGASILISDVTALKKAETVRSEFSANVSHELKTPLTSIKGFTDMLSSGMVTSEVDRQRFLTLIGVEVDRLIELINDILKLSELDSVAIAQCEEHADVLATAQAAAELLAPTAQRGQITLTVSGCAAQAAIPAGRLKELLVNLMENGIKYNEPGGSVALTVAPLEGQIKITVTDTGIGIPPEAQGRVCERFFRVDKGRAKAHGGSGLGLAIVKHITALYGGTLALESAVGKGSTFTVTLPQG